VEIHNQMQGADEFVVSGNLKGWDRWKDLPLIKTPTLAG
jgi:proline iminopeptidase